MSNACLAERTAESEAVELTTSLADCTHTLTKLLDGSQFLLLDYKTKSFRNTNISLCGFKLPDVDNASLICMSSVYLSVACLASFFSLFQVSQSICNKARLSWLR